VDFVQECSSNLDWQEVEVKSASSPGKVYKVSIPPWKDGEEDITCDCPSFVHRGYCRHLQAALGKVCNWASTDPIPQTEEQRRNQICPRCGAKTVLTEKGEDD
jgi:hypothetical protein